MKGLFPVLFMFFVASPCLSIGIISDANPNFNVVDYGARGDGQCDDSEAFVKVWEDVCRAIEGTPTLLIPQGKRFLLQPVEFKGACNSASIIVELQGDLVAPNSMDAWKWADNDKGKRWIRFSGINGLVVHGGGQIDGQGAAWWKYYDSQRPVALSFHNCQGLQLINLTNINSPGSHMSVNGCNGSYISNLHIVAPEDSPNTDGIDISASSNVIIQHSKMEAGDDCIAINGGSSFINITDVACGPGHGISVGSLGKNGGHDKVEEIHVRNCSFNGTQNGVRIKTWVGGHGYARKITFEDIIVTAVKNPVIIDQNYDPNDAATNSAVNVSDITYYKVYGTSAVANAIKLNCDNSTGCTNIVLQDINIASSVPGKETYASCNNVHGTSSVSTPSIPCLLN